MNAFSRTAVAALTLLAVAATSPPAFGQSEPAARLARLVGRLGEASLPASDRVTERLIEANPAAEVYLYEAAAFGTSLAKQRAEQILRQRRVNSLWEPTLLKFPQREVLLSDLLWRIEQARPVIIHNMMLLGGRDRTIALPAQQLPLLQALEIARTEYRKAHASTTLSSQPRNSAHAYSGPCQLELVSAVQNPDSHGLTLQFRLAVEPRLPVMSNAQRPSEVLVTWGGVNQQQSQHAELNWRSFAGESSSVFAETTLQLPEPVEGLTALKVTWPLCAAAVQSGVRVPHPRSGLSFLSEAGEFTVENWNSNSAVIRVENLRSWPEPAEALRASYRWYGEGCGKLGVEQFELTETGARWHLLPPERATTQALLLEYHAEFSRQDIVFHFEQVDLQQACASGPR